MYGEATAKTPTALADEWAQRKESLPTVRPKIDGDGEELGFSEPLEGIFYLFLIFRNCCELETSLNVVKCPRGLGLASSASSFLQGRRKQRLGIKWETGRTFSILGMWH